MAFLCKNRVCRRRLSLGIPVAQGTTGSMSERNADGTTQEVWRMVPPGIRERYETLLQEVNASYARLDKSLREYQTKENDQAPWNDCAFGRYRGGCHGTTRDRQSGARVSNHGAEEECLEGAVNSVGVASGECGHYEAGSKALHNDMLDDLNSSVSCESIGTFSLPVVCGVFSKPSIYVYLVPHTVMVASDTWYVDEFS